jgi:hypothetical protein
LTTLVFRGAALSKNRKFSVKKFDRLSVLSLAFLMHCSSAKINVFCSVFQMLVKKKGTLKRLLNLYILQFPKKTPIKITLSQDVFFGYEIVTFTSFSLKLSGAVPPSHPYRRVLIVHVMPVSVSEYKVK